MSTQHDTERDQLAQVIEEAIADDRAIRTELIAATILAAGWTRPRTITTDEETDKLPAGSIILDSDPDALLRLPDGSWRSLHDPEEPYATGYITLPATLLHVPGATA